MTYCQGLRTTQHTTTRNLERWWVSECSASGWRGADEAIAGWQSTNCRKRLIRDFKRLSSDPPGGISGSPLPDNIMLWNAVIFGPGTWKI